MCCAYVGLDNKLNKMHGTYIKIGIFCYKYREFSFIQHLSQQTVQTKHNQTQIIKHTSLYLPVACEVHVGLMIFVVIKVPGNGTLVPKHVGVGT
jgi:hypothetical protein